MPISTVTIVGAGYMGGGIAQVLALAGFDVTIADLSVENANASLERLRKEAWEFEEQGLYAPGSAELVAKNISAGRTIEDAVADVDFIEEAVFERLDVKHDVLAKISAHARPDAIIGTNTSTIPVKELVSAVSHPERFLTVHFSNPAPFIPGVELVAGEATSPETVAAVKELLSQSGNQGAQVADTPGMVLNRLQYALLKEATSIVEEGVATAEDVDTIVRTTFGYRLGFFGPFAIADQAGLDVYANCFVTFEDAFGDRLATPQLLTDAVAGDRKGVKNGRGLLGDYDEATAAELIAYRNTAYAKMSQLLDELGPAPGPPPARTEPPVPESMLLPPARRLLILDDDPTGSQCVAGIDVAFDLDPAIPVEVLSTPGSACFVLTNTRALGEDAATALTRRIVGGVLDGGVPASGLHVVSRSDSTLRGHVIAEPVAIADELATHGVEVDAFVLCPAMIEAGRFTEGDIHYATVDGQAVEVAETDFARDATFGYSHSDLREFLAERSGGAIDTRGVLSISLEDIRSGGLARVRGLLAGARDRAWVVVNATEYSDMEVVAEAIAALEAEGRTYVTRCAPSFVRPLTGQSGAHVVDAHAIDIPAGRLDHGLVVVGSHVGLTTTQLRAVQERGTLTEVEIDVPSVLDGRREQHLTDLARRVRESLTDSDCVLYTSRELVRTDDPAESLAIARSVSDAVVEVVQRVRGAKPAWVVAKGGITSHEVAASGLGIRRARVEGQFWAGQVSLFSAQEAPAEVMGMPYVVFPGNVGGAQALADVVDTLTAAAVR